MKFIPSILAIFFIVTSLTAQTEIDKIKNSIDKNSIQGPIYFLADDLLKGRETGTPENKVAAAYLANQLRSYGVQPNPKSGDYYQKFNLEQTTPPQQLNLSINGKNITNVVALNGDAIAYTNNAVFLGYGLEDDYKGKNVKGKVILIKGGNPEAGDVRTAFRYRRTKQELAQKAEVAAIIELVNAENRTWDFIDHNFNTPQLGIASDQPNDTVNYLWVQDENENLVNTLEKGKNKVSLNSTGFLKGSVQTQNVVGVVEGTDPSLKNEYIIYSAHYDHVGIGTADATGDTIYNGARDNAVGATTVLAMAKNLAKYPTKRSALFILFTGEEKGLLGSEYYVENPVLPLKQMVYCFNSDNAGYNDTSLATIIGLERTTAARHIKNAAKAFGLTAVDDPAPEQGLFDRSDNVHFAAKGIPAPTFSMGFTAFNGDVTKYYHQPGDQPESLDFDYLEKFFRAYVLAGRNIANDPTTPFWTKGDKYESAGNKLYEK